jgi:hypothetical protein
MVVVGKHYNHFSNVSSSPKCNVSFSYQNHDKHHMFLDTVVLFPQCCFVNHNLSLEQDSCIYVDRVQNILFN